MYEFYRLQFVETELHVEKFNIIPQYSTNGTQKVPLNLLNLCTCTKVEVN